MRHQYIRLKYLLLTLCMAAILLFAHSGQGRVAADQAGSGLFVTSNNQGDTPVTTQTHVLRHRLVDLRLEQLGGPTPRVSEFAESLELNLFDDASYTAVRTGLEYANATGAWVWRGVISGIPMSSVTLSIQDGVLGGAIRGGGDLYEVGYLGAGAHIIYQIDEGAVPDEAEPRAARPLAAAEMVAADLRLEEGSDDGSIQDLLVVYTPAARSAAGGTAAIENLINVGVAETNQSYANSNITHRLNLVHVSEVSYTEADLFTDLNRLENPSDGFMDDVHTLRDAHKADLVTLINEDGSGFCGVAGMILNPVSTALEDQAFNVTWRLCITPNYTFGHELGHLQGARHNWEADPTNNAPYTFNHGYGETASSGFPWRSIMAYTSACSCNNRELRWSNPNLTHPVTGNPTGRPTSGSQATDNAQTLDLTSFTVANFRVSTPIVYDEFLNMPIIRNGN